jgi:hypothetical protein
MPRADGGDGGDGGHGAQPAAEIAASPSDGTAAPVSGGGAQREVVAWLSTVGLERYAPQLIEAGYDRLVFLEGMDDAEADEAAATCGMLRPHVRAFKTAAQELHRAAAGAPTPAAAAAAAATVPAGVSVSVEVQPAPTPAPVLHAAPLVVAAGARGGTTVVLGESVEAVAAVPAAAASSSGQLQPQPGGAWQRARAAGSTHPSAVALPGAAGAESFEQRNIEKDQLVKNVAQVVAQVKAHMSQAKKKGVTLGDERGGCGCRHRSNGLHEVRP